MTLAEKMIAYRARENISQTELASRCNVNVMTISSAENGKYKPRKTTEAKILRVIEEGE